MATRIRELRKEMGYSQVRLSVELGVSQESISAYESGKNYPNTENLLKLSVLLHSSIDYILGVSSVRHPSLSIPMTAKEQHLLNQYREFDDKKKNLIDSYIEALNS